MPQKLWLTQLVKRFSQIYLPKHWLEKAARGISLCINLDKMKQEFMSFKQDESIATLYGKTLTLVD